MTNTTNTAAGASSLLATFGSALALCAAFLVPSELIRVFCSRTVHRRVFEPRLARRGAISGKVPDCPQWPLAWLVLAYATNDTDQDFLDEIGLDAAVYIGTCRLGLRIILTTAWFDLGVVMPLNMRDNYVYTNPDESLSLGVSDLDRFSMSNVHPGSSYLWAHAASTMFKTYATLFLLDQFSAFVFKQQQIARLKFRWTQPSRKTVLVTRVPVLPGGELDNVHTQFEKWWGADAIRYVTPVVNDSVIGALALEKEAAGRQLLAARLAVEKGAPTKRRKGLFRSDSGELDDVGFFEGMLLQVNVMLATAKKSMIAKPPVGRVAGFGRGGLLRPAAFVTFSTERQAAAAAQMATSTSGASWKVVPAPDPAAIVWNNVGRYTPTRIAFLRLFSWTATVSLCASFIPLSAFVQALMQTRNVVKYVKSAWLTKALSGKTAQNLVEGVLPSVLLTLLAWVWPIFLRLFTIWQGASTLAEVDRGMCAKAFLFNVLVAFVATVLGGSLVAGLSQFYQNPAKLLAVKIPAQGRFFMNYVIFQGVGASGPLIARWWQALQYWGRKEDEEKPNARWPPFPQPFGRLYPHVLLQIQICVIFSTIAPLMQAISLLYFLPALGCAKTKMFWHHEPAYEGQGRMWPLIRTLVIIILLVYQLTMCSMLALKNAVYPAWITGVASILPTLAAARRMASRYDESMTGIVPLEVLVAREDSLAKSRLERAKQPAPPPSPPPALMDEEHHSAAQSPGAVPHAHTTHHLRGRLHRTVPYLHPALNDPSLDAFFAANTDEAKRLEKMAGPNLLATVEKLTAIALATRLGRLASAAARMLKPLLKCVYSQLVDRPAKHRGGEDGDDETRPPSPIDPFDEATAEEEPRSLQHLRLQLASRHNTQPSGGMGRGEALVELITL